MDDSHRVVQEIVCANLQSTFARTSTGKEGTTSTSGYARFGRQEHHRDVHTAKHNKHDTAFGPGNYCVIQAALSPGVDQRDDPLRS